MSIMLAGLCLNVVHSFKIIVMHSWISNVELFPIVSVYVGLSGYDSLVCTCVDSN